ncbi:MAG: bifunctional serine/threonine-protein kinase/formylglycine-generating enzyme family protein [Aureliella sp.]
MTNSEPDSRLPDCIDERLLLDWLEERASLSDAQIAHIAECAVCAARLENASDIPEYSAALRSLEDADSERQARFEREDAFKSLRVRMRDLSAHEAQQPTRPGISAELATSASDQTLLANLQTQLAQTRYQLSRVLGRGATSVVALAFDQEHSRDVAIKFLLSTDLATRERFRREAEILREAHHENIVRIFEFGECPASRSMGIDAENALFIVMEYVAGGTSRELEFCQSFGFAAIAEYFSGAALGLQFAHEKKLIHRDVKPSNLLLDTRAKTLKVSDFGLARSRSQDATQLTATGEILGTPEFMSPEHVLGERFPQGTPSEVSEQSDIYSLGATLYAILSGSSPVRGSVAAILRQIPEVDPPRLTLINPAIPKPLEIICEKAMRKLPTDRYASMQQFADDLLRFARGEQINAKPLNPIQLALRWSHRYPALATAIGSIVLLVGIGLVAATLAAFSFRDQQVRLLDERLAYRKELCQRIASAAPEAVPLAIQQVQLSPEEFLPMLQQAWDQAEEPRARINLACALACVETQFDDFLLSAITSGSTAPGHTDAITLALESDRSRGMSLIRSEFAKTADLLAKCRLAIHAARLGDTSLIANIARTTPDDRTQITHLIPEWFGNRNDLANAIRECQDRDALFVLISGLGLIPAQSMDTNQLADICAILRSISGSAKDQGVVSAATWALRRLGLKLTKKPKSFDFGTPVSLAENEEVGIRMIPVQPGSFTMGGLHPFDQNTGRTPHPVDITKKFYLSDREISTGLFRAFLRDTGLEASSGDWQPDTTISPTDSHPAQRVSWDQAVQFCNWLSRQHGFYAVYEEDGEMSFELADGQTWTGKKWKRFAERNGYRLPTEAEYEYACRAGSETLYSFGDSPKFFSHYVAWTNNTRVACQPCGQLMPNRWGFFDLHGNVWEWCEDWYRPLESDQLAVDPINSIPTKAGRSFRGGGVFTFTGYPYSSSRGSTMPQNQFSNVGFRIARTAQPKP